MDFKTTKQAALEWGITPRRVQILCQQNRVDGAVKVGGVWLLPNNICQPVKLKTGPKADKIKSKKEDKNGRTDKQK